MGRRFLKVVFRLTALSALICLFAGSAAAQETESPTASAGTMMAAALETVGYYSQAQILQDLSEMISTLGALIYLGVISSIILTVALMGNYRSALWMLVGPPLFVWLSGVEVNGVSNRTAGAGVEWQFGTFKDPGFKQQLLNEAEPTVGQPGQVSYFFHKYNLLISEGVQELIEIVTNKDTLAQMQFMTRQRLLEELVGVEIDNSGWRSLGNFFIFHCASELTSARIIARAQRIPSYKSEPEYGAAKSHYCSYFDVRNKPLPPGAAQDYVWSLWQTGDEPLNNVTKADNLNGIQADHPHVSCFQMYKWLFRGARREVQELGEMIAKTAFSPASWSTRGKEIWDRAVLAVWQILTTTKEVEHRRTQGEDECPLNLDDQTATIDAQFEQVARLIAAFAMRKQLSSPTDSFLTKLASGAGGIVPSGTGPQEGQVSPPQKQESLARQRQGEFAVARKYEAFALLTLLPYVQGLILYALSVMYPFFCLFVIAPGRASGLFTWMALWAWAKSWDVGFAMVMVADNLLWELMPHASFFDADAETTYTPISLMQMAYEGDHGYTTSTYWLLVCSLITAVPIVSAEAILGAKKSIGNLLVKGVREIAQKVGHKAGLQLAAELSGKQKANYERAGTELMLNRSMGFYNTSTSLNASVDNIMRTPLQQTKNSVAGSMNDFTGILEGPLSKIPGAADAVSKIPLVGSYLGNRLKNFDQRAASQNHAAKGVASLAQARGKIEDALGGASIGTPLGLAQWIGGSDVKWKATPAAEQEKAALHALGEAIRMDFNKPLGHFADSKRAQEQLNGMLVEMVKARMAARYMEGKGQQDMAALAPLLVGAGAGIGNIVGGTAMGLQSLQGGAVSRRRAMDLTFLQNEIQAKAARHAAVIGRFEMMNDPTIAGYTAARNYFAENRAEFFEQVDLPQKEQYALDMEKRKLEIERERVREMSKTSFLRWLSDSIFTLGGTRKQTH